MPEEQEKDYRAILETIRARIPGFPDDFERRTEATLSAVLSHGQKQILMWVAQMLEPPIERAAFEADTSVGEFLYWLGGRELIDVSSMLPPRGSYRSLTTILRPIEDADIMPLYRGSIAPPLNHRWRHRGRTPAPEVFRSLLFSDGNIAQFIVQPLGISESDRLLGPGVGLVSAYNCDLVSGHCYIAVQRFDGGAQATDESRGQMAEGLLIFIQYLFDHFGFRKIYFEVPEFNVSLLDGFPGDVLLKEAELGEHIYYGDRYWSQTTFALYYSTWESFAPFFRGEWPDGRR